MSLEIGIILLLVVVVVVATNSRPAAFRLVRSATIAAPPNVVFGLVNDFHQWKQWSPWEKLDPNMQRSFEGPPMGAGSVYRWAGNGKAGEGSMTITESTPSQRVAIDLQFLKPFKARNVTEFTFSPTSGGTGVTWAMSGEKNLVMKAFTIFMNMEKTVGADFERGLAALGTLAEAGSRGAGV